MIAIQNRIERKEPRKSYPMERVGLPQAALERYGLAGANVEDLPDMVAGEEERIFLISFPESIAAVHPYLGRLAGKIFTLRMMPASEESRTAALEWEKESAALCRDTDEDAPEPVPACDGSLVTLVTLGEETRHCIVYR